MLLSIQITRESDGPTWHAWADSGGRTFSGYAADPYAAALIVVGDMRDHAAAAREQRQDEEDAGLGFAPLGAAPDNPVRVLIHGTDPPTDEQMIATAALALGGRVINLRPNGGGES